MEKGKLGVKLCFYGVTAFILALLGYSTLLFLLAGVVLLVEKDEWTSRQVIQAFCLCVVSSLIYDIVGVFDFLYNLPVIGSAWSTVVSVINGLISIAVFALCIVGIINNSKGKDANIPLASKFADWAFGIVTQKVTPQPAQNFNAQNQNFAAQNQNFNAQNQNFAAQNQNFNAQNQNFAAQNQNFNAQNPNVAPQAPVNGQFYQQAAPTQMPQQGETVVQPAPEANQNQQ